MEKQIYNFIRAGESYIKDRVDTDIDSSTIFIDVPSGSIRSFLRINCDNHTLTAEFF